MKHLVYILFYLIVLLAGCNHPADSPYPPLTFTEKTSIPGSGRASSVAFVIDNKAYVTLGRNGADSLKTCWQYNPASDSWTEKAAFPGKARVKATATVVNGKAYVGLGFDHSKGAYTDGSILVDFWMYSPQTDSWTRKSDFPSQASNACVSFEYKGDIYVGSGFNGFGFTYEFWKYSVSEDKWIRINDFSGPARAGGVLCATDERIFFGTGYRTWNENDWWEYFPATDSWIKRKSMPDNGRVNGVSFSVDNRFFVSTGRHWGGDKTGGHVKSDVMEYDAIRDVWYARGNIPASGRENAIVFIIEGKVYIGFGDNDNSVLNDLWCFEP